MSRDYEETALSGELDEFQKQRVLESWLEHGNVAMVVADTGLPRDLVHATISDPSLARRALELESSKAALFLATTGLRRLQDMVLTGSDTKQLQALKELRGYVDAYVEGGRGPGRPRNETPIINFNLERVVKQIDGASEEIRRVESRPVGGGDPPVED